MTSRSELLIIAGARALAGRRVCFVGIGLPNIAVTLAQRTVAPDLELIYESGVYGSVPPRQPLSIGDPCLVTGSLAVMPMPELFQYYLQGGRVDVGFLGAAQLNRHGDVNTTVIGDYDSPKVRLPGSGGACDIALNAGEVFILMRQSTRSFVERVDFVTSPGRPPHRRGLTTVITDLGEYGFEEGELALRRLHPGVTLDEVHAATGWRLRISRELGETPAPTAEELRLLRSELDPNGTYRK
ncbi:glutaconate CoA-transferase subunit B [Stackebrandtia endophytica]|uniref:Glutaconate CoA-transferase subunit B n=1 Tax=Stackebrandtia endophytica TaxID=1496996 RepID=A0A543B3M8_9ACTN|nr:CoA-transferase [Stackebrandtia endophytica]TQL79445.1 glutaconate CoA-transferase subunit B [Stackebrandtia endophytica]